MRLKTMTSVFALSAVTALAGCASGGPDQQSPYQRAAGTYEGVLPCPDCSGIRTQLEIKNQDNIAANYTLKSTRLGKSQEPMTNKGSVLVLEDVGPNSYPVVYQLKGPNGNDIYNLLPLGDGDLQLLDRNFTKMQSSNDLTLKRR
ncbi:copper resistance protein NlpE N-terminal domain-containing protein [Phytohalomonas tamaricis]|uniref:copper resistance protein NlpE N-terminal domain-containing protein n=1 Tax=Phytohalomonas tamaricis TaxID=2081032 RepID=UPI000D0B3A27|nr:copper resistance protein NlpE N-terminal domain-containing protein [Phytohalomonas tamaricis]